MLIYILWGLLTGFLIPFIAGRFGKIIPADPGMILLSLYHRPHRPKVYDPARKFQLHLLWKKLYFWGIFWAISTAVIYTLIYIFLPSSLHLFSCIFTWIIFMCIVIDAQYWLLPDFFTIPLLLLGLIFNTYISNHDISYALIGSVSGYLISVLSVLVMVKSKHKELGSGDVKMMTALGAWLGLMGLNICLILSFFFFIILSYLPFQKKGAYGPALGLAALIVFFINFLK